MSLKQTHFETEKSQTKQLREQKNLNLKFFVQWHKFTLRHLLKAIVCLSKNWVYKILQELRLKFELYVGGREKWKRAVSDRKNCCIFGNSYNAISMSRYICIANA